jgi:hypothetical protein
VDYESMTMRELQEECRRRGLPSGRAKAELVQRLTDADTAEAGSADDDFNDGGMLAADLTAAVNETVEPEPVLPQPKPRATAVPMGLFRMDFDAEPDGPDEETHLAYRQATTQAARDAGAVPRGDAYLAATTGGRWVYEVRVRQGS